MRPLFFVVLLLALGLAEARAELILGPAHIADTQVPVVDRPKGGGLSSAEAEALELLLVAAARHVEVSASLWVESVDAEPTAQVQALSEALRLAARRRGLRADSWTLRVHPVQGWMREGQLQIMLFGDGPAAADNDATLAAEWIHQPQSLDSWTGRGSRQAALQQAASLALCETEVASNGWARCQLQLAPLRRALLHHRELLEGATLEQLQARWQAWARLPWPAELPALLPAGGPSYQAIARAALCRYDIEGAEAAQRVLPDWRVLREASPLEQQVWWICAAASPTSVPLRKLQRAGLNIRQLAPAETEKGTVNIGVLNRAVELLNAGPRTVERLLQAKAPVDQPGVELSLLLAAASTTGTTVCPPSFGLQQADYEQRYELLRRAGASRHERDRFGRTAAKMHEFVLCMEFQRCLPGRTAADY